MWGFFWPLPVKYVIHTVWQCRFWSQKAFRAGFFAVQFWAKSIQFWTKLDHKEHKKYDLGHKSTIKLTIPVRKLSFKNETKIRWNQTVCIRDFLKQSQRFFHLFLHDVLLSWSLRGNGAKSFQKVRSSSAQSKKVEKMTLDKADFYGVTIVTLPRESRKCSLGSSHLLELTNPIWTSASMHATAIYIILVNMPKYWDPI